jgi:hypothetical protein
MNEEKNTTYLVEIKLDYSEISKIINSYKDAYELVRDLQREGHKINDLKIFEIDRGGQ